MSAPHLLDLALRYLAGGLSIIPVGSNKRPLSESLPIDPANGKASWKLLQTKSADEAMVRAWCGNPGLTGLAMICGAASGGLLILDFDEPRLYDAWIKGVGSLADGLPVQRTGDGFQLAVRCDDPGRNDSLAWVPDEEAKTGRRIAIETRGEGGYALLPGSRHPNGRIYEATVGDFAAIPRRPMEQVRVLLAAARQLDEAPFAKQQLETAHSATVKPRRDVPEGGGVIGEWNRQVPLRDMLERAGYTRHGVRYTRPGGESLGSVVVFDDSGKSYHHSTDDPLHGKHAHDSFSVLCQTEHGGDVAAAVRAAALELGLSGRSYQPRPAGPKAEAETVTEPQGFSGISRVVSPSAPGRGWRPFPVEAFPQPLRDAARAYSRAVQVDPSLVCLPLLSALSACVGNSRRLVIKRGYSVPAVLWTGAIGKSGCGKTPARNAVLRPLWVRESALIRGHEAAVERYKPLKAAHEAAMKKWANKGGAAGEEPPQPPEAPACERLILQDATVEAVADRLRESPRGVLLERDELAGWFRSFNQYKGGKGSDAANWLSMYDAATVIVDRKTGDRKVIHIPLAAVPIAGGIQPAILADALGREHFEDGMAARFLFAWAPAVASPWTEDDIDEESERALSGVYSRLLALKCGTGRDREAVPVEIPLSPPAKRLWTAYHDEVARELPGMSDDLAAVFSKLRASAARLALVLFLARTAGRDSGAAVDEASMESGVTLARWFGHEARRIYGLLPALENTRQRLRVIERHGGWVTVREWQRACRWETSEEAEADLRGMVEDGVLVAEVVPPGPNGGPSTTRYRMATDASRDTTPETTGNSGVVSQEGGQDAASTADADDSGEV